MRQKGSSLKGLFLGLVIIYCLAGSSLLQDVAHGLQSTNYKIDESSLGAGGLIQSNSANFQGRDSIGDIGVGNSESSNYQINSGTNTPDAPNLSVTIDAASVELGTLSASATVYGTAQFSVLNYTSYGYVVHLGGTTLSSGSFNVNPLSENSPSQPGISQFGINLVANTSPTGLGSDPDNGSFGFGEVNTHYATPNEYRFVSGEAIAFAPKSSGKTTYTITYIANVEGLTPAGVYTTAQSIIVTGTY